MKYSVFALDKKTGKDAWAAKNLDKDIAVESAMENAEIDNFYIYVANDETLEFVHENGEESYRCKFWNKL